MGGSRKTESTNIQNYLLSHCQAATVRPIKETATGQESMFRNTERRQDYLRLLINFSGTRDVL